MSAFASESRVGSGRHSMSVASGAVPADDHPSSLDGDGGGGGGGDADRVGFDPAVAEGEPAAGAEAASISFIQPEILKHLQRELDIEVVENEFSFRVWN